MSMSFAEIFSRIGGATGGWLIFIGHCLILVVLPQADCEPGAEPLWRGTLFFGLLSAIALVFVGRGMKWQEALRWFAAPAGVLAIYAAFQIFPGVQTSTIEGGSLCAIARPTAAIEGITATTVERIWVPIQLSVLAFGLIQSVRFWRPANVDSSSA